MSDDKKKDDAEAKPKKGKKGLIIIIAAVLLLAGGGGAGWFFFLKPKPEASADAEEDHKPAAHKEKGKVKTFATLDPFTVNLADRQADRYAQVGITLEIEDAKTGDEIKAFMPAIRNNVLMAIGDRTAADLLGREGKALLAERIRREASRALGYEVDDKVLDARADDAPAQGKKTQPAAAAALPVKAVHFSNFIIQ